MSYAKAMKHHRNPRKWKARQPILCAGYGRVPVQKSELLIAHERVKNWLKQRHDGDRQHARDCIRWAISEFRLAQEDTDNA